jgi:uncharacterized membrane protein
MSETNPAVERYLARFTEALPGVSAAERGEMVHEIRSHIAEALFAGRDAAEVLAKLGPAERLAAAYRAELLLNRPPSSAGRLARIGLVSALAGTSLLSLLVISLLASVALSFVVSGLAVFLVGLGLPLIPEPLVSSPFTRGQSQVIMMVVGAVSLVLGLAAAMGLWAYVRFAGRTVQGLLARIRTRVAAPAV